jgi:hypothetical protein
VFWVGEQVTRKTLLLGILGAPEQPEQHPPNFPIIRQQLEMAPYPQQMSPATMWLDQFISDNSQSVPSNPSIALKRFPDGSDMCMTNKTELPESATSRACIKAHISLGKG